MIKILQQNHEEEFSELFREAQDEINIISPYLSAETGRLLCEAAEQGISCTFITRAYIEEFLSGSNNIGALRRMLDSGVKVYAVKRLHAKLYLFDKATAVIGSANFTVSGFKRNIELSVLAKDEADFIAQLHDSFTGMLSDVISAGGGEMSTTVLDDLDARCTKAHLSKVGSGSSFTTYSYGADLYKRSVLANPIDEHEAIKCEIEETIADSNSDLVHDVLKEIKIASSPALDHNIWLKFEGVASDRGDGSEIKTMACVSLNGETLHIANAAHRFARVKDGDEIYIASISTDRKGRGQPIIVGRGVLRGFSNSNEVPSVWLEQYPWMNERNWYCVIDHYEVLNTNVSNGVPLYDVTREFGSDTYTASVGKNETPKQVLKKHHQKSYMAITAQAKAFIDTEFDRLKAQYGVVEYSST